MNVLLMAQRRGRVEQGKIPLILQTLSNLPISTDKREIDINDESFINFANQYQLTSYDATYLYLAKREKIPVATLDKKMQQVAIELGLFLK